MLSERNTDSCLGSLDNIMKQLQTQDKFAFSQMLNQVMTGAMKMKNQATIAAVDRVSQERAFSICVFRLSLFVRDRLGRDVYTPPPLDQSYRWTVI